MREIEFTVTVTEEFDEAVKALVAAKGHPVPGDPVDTILAATVKGALASLAHECHAHGLLPHPAHWDGGRA